jgi:putative hemolysin
MFPIWKAGLQGLLIAVAACSAPQVEPETPSRIGTPNPAAVNCQREGGEHQVRRSAAGDQYGVCVFPDGRQCEEWALYRDRRCVAPSQTGQ